MMNLTFLDVAMDPVPGSNSGLIIGIVLVVVVAVAAFLIVRTIKKRKNNQ